MRKLFTSLLPALLFILGAGSTWAQTSAYERTENRLSVEALTSGKLVTIQARDINNSGFFSGASHLSSNFQQNGSTVYRIEKEGEKFIFQQVSSSHYLQAPNRDNESIRFAAEKQSAARMTITRAMDVPGKRAPYSGTVIAGTILSDLYRIVDTSGRDLNCGNTSTTPTWTKNRHGGFTYFYIWEVKQVEVVSFTYTYKLGGVSLPSLNQSVVVKLGEKIPLPNVPAGLQKGKGYSTDITGDVATTAHHNKTYEVNIELPFNPEVQYNSEGKFYTLAIRESKKKVVWSESSQKFENKVVEETRNIGESEFFQFVGDSNLGFRVYSRKTKQALGGVKENKTPLKPGGSPGGIYDLLIGDNGSVRGFVLRYKDAEKNSYVHDHQETGLSYWCTGEMRGLNDQGSFLYFREVDLEYERLKNQLTTYPIGEGYGAYKRVDAYTQAETCIAEIEGKKRRGEEVSPELYSEAKTKLKEAIDKMKQTFKMPAETALLRIAPQYGGTNKRLKGKRMSETNSDFVLVNDTEAENDWSTIFYYQEGIGMMCLGESKPIVIEPSDELGSSNQRRVVISSNYFDGKVVAKIGSTANHKYTLSFGTGADVPLCADGSDSATGSGAGTEEGKREFMLYEVTSIPLPISEVNYATFWTPEPVSLPTTGEFEAYSATRSGESLLLEKIEGIIPKETAFIVKRVKGDQQAHPICHLKVESENVQTTSIAKNGLWGGDTSKELSSSGMIFALTKKEGANNEVVFAKIMEPARPIAFRAFYTEESGGTIASTLGLSFGKITGIAAQSKENNGTPFFDLSGRRVQNPQSGGIYLQNGKKIVVQPTR